MAPIGDLTCFPFAATPSSFPATHCEILASDKSLAATAGEERANAGGKHLKGNGDAGIAVPGL